MVGSSFAVSTLTRRRTSSHSDREAATTPSKSQVGISASAFRHAWAALMKETPKRAVTKSASPAPALNAKRAPACTGDVSDVKAYETVVFRGVIVIVEGVDGEEEYVPNWLRREEFCVGEAKS